MAVIGATYLTLMDNMRRTDPDNKIAAVIELMSETNEVIQDALAVEGNSATGHVTTIRTGLPTATWRKLYGGIQPSKSTTKQVTDTCGMLEALSEIDVDLLKLNGNSAAFKLSENEPFIESMNQGFVDALFYGDTAINPEQFMGFAPRFDSLAAENGGQIVDAGGVGSDNTSIWIIAWGDNLNHLIYPKGSDAGLKVDPKGEQMIQKADGSRFFADVTHYKWDVGLTVRDWRYVVRIANIDVSNLAGAGGSGYAGADLINLLIEGLNRLWSLNKGSIAIYANRTVWNALDKLAVAKANVHLGFTEFAGKKILTFRGYPMRRVDAILNTEARVV